MTRPGDDARYRRGLAAERLCRLVLRLKFYRILAARYKTQVGEIDIVAVRGRTLVAVEVKAREEIAATLSAISPDQRARIARALDVFAQRHPRFAGYDRRFDVMGVAPRSWPLHIVNAWQNEGR